jgi:hypothetical protein
MLLAYSIPKLSSSFCVGITTSCGLQIFSIAAAPARAKAKTRSHPSSSSSDFDFDFDLADFELEEEEEPLLEEGAEEEREREEEIEGDLDDDDAWRYLPVPGAEEVDRLWPEERGAVSLVSSRVVTTHE